MNKPTFTQPVIVYMYGLPGSGKSFVARQLSEVLGLTHISSDRLRFELFEDALYDKTEHLVLTNLMNYMTELFIDAGNSVVYDLSTSRISDRKALRALAKRKGAKELMVWVQIDADTAYARSTNRDKRKADDKYSKNLTKAQFENFMKGMQNPQQENYVVVSGKHVFTSQKNTIVRKLVESGILSIQESQSSIAKPEMVNLVSRAHAQVGRVDYSRRNINIL
jgi:predicted kinase